jgi:hypothetical protein
MDAGLDYRAWIPRKLKQELRKVLAKAHAIGWGVVAYVEFNYIIFLCFWGIINFNVALALCLGLSVPKSGPLHGCAGSGIVVFFGLFGLLGIFYGVVYKSCQTSITVQVILAKGFW